MSSRKNIFVIYPPGAGGNHIANMLSTDRRFQFRANVQDYVNHEHNNAHVTKIKNLNRLHVEKISSLENHVLCGHWAEFYWLLNDGIVEKFPNRQIVIVKFPKQSSIAYHRFLKQNNVNSEYLIQEQTSLYTTKIVQSTFGEFDIFEIDSDMIFNTSLDNFFKFTDQEMNLSLDINQCNQMHRVWFYKIQDSHQ